MKISINNINKVYKAKRSSVETMQLKGYELIKELFVDNSGFGASDEPALTRSQFEIELEAILTKHGELTAKITNVGQFQVYIGLFKKTGKNKSKRIGNNTLEIIYSDGSKAIRLHDTNVVTFKKDKIILDSGGWRTNTTKARINQYSPFTVYQKDFDWFVVVNNDWSKLIPFKDGMKLSA